MLAKKVIYTKKKKKNIAFFLKATRRPWTSVTLCHVDYTGITLILYSYHKGKKK